MHRKVRVPNPDCRAVAVNWGIRLEEPAMAKGMREGELEIAFRSKDRKGRRTSFVFPCSASAKKFSVRMNGTVKRHVPDGSVSQRAFSVENRMAKEPENEFLRIFKSIVDTVARRCGGVITSIQGAVSITGTDLLPPKLMRIPRMITVREISYEELLREGQL